MQICIRQGTIPGGMGGGGGGDMNPATARSCPRCLIHSANRHYKKLSLSFSTQHRSFVLPRNKAQYHTDLTTPSFTIAFNMDRDRMIIFFLSLQKRLPRPFKAAQSDADTKPEINFISIFYWLRLRNGNISSKYDPYVFSIPELSGLLCRRIILE